MEKIKFGFIGIAFSLAACSSSDIKYEKFPVHRVGNNLFKVIVESQSLAKAKNVAYQVAEFHCKKIDKQSSYVSESVNSEEVHTIPNYVFDLSFTCN